MIALVKNAIATTNITSGPQIFDSHLKEGTPRFADQVSKPIIYILVYIIYIMRSSA
ncbi:hypothetical protein LPIBR_10125 [Lacticaseibacillus paracasei]|nr:hypothetical protein LPIBR_10125 [Lacticaseibacillus paracasei]